MKIKVVMLKAGDSPTAFGLKAIPSRYHKHINSLVDAWSCVLDPFLPVSLEEFVSRIRHLAGDDIEAIVDADLLAEYADMAADAFESQGRTLYRLDTCLMP